MMILETLLICIGLLLPPMVIGSGIVEQYSAAIVDGFNRQSVGYPNSDVGVDNKSDVPRHATHLTNPNMAQAQKSYTQHREIPIYEDHKNDYTALDTTQSTNPPGGWNGIATNSQNLFTIHANDASSVAAGDSFVPHYKPTTSNGDGVSGASGVGVDSEDDKISGSDFAHHYDHNYSGFHNLASISFPYGNVGDGHDTHEDNEQYQQLHHYDYEHGNHGVNHDIADGSYGSANIDSTSHQPDVINYLPYPVFKKLYIPFSSPVKIPIPNAILLPIRKPVPIEVPVHKQVQVQVEKELRIPVEKLVPYPVEKHVPVPIERHIPYPVIKYIPKYIPKPFPVKVPSFKTILHKVKKW